MSCLPGYLCLFFYHSSTPTTVATDSHLSGLRTNRHTLFPTATPATTYTAPKPNGSNGLSRLIQHSDTHMPDEAGTSEATGEGVTELVIALPHGGSVAVQFNPYLVIEHPLMRRVMCELLRCGSAGGNTSHLTLIAPLSASAQLLMNCVTCVLKQHSKKAEIHMKPMRVGGYQSPPFLFNKGLC